MNRRGIRRPIMNQGNDSSHASEDGTWQDGALFIQQGQHWTAIFLMVQSQQLPTDDYGYSR
nr:DUF2278 family protein [Ktedonobacter sp. SOSP1-85]